MADMARLQLVVRGAKKQQTKKGSQGRLRLPITVEIMWELKHAWERAGCPEGQMLWAAASLCFFGFLRSGEMTVPEGAQYDESTHLSFRDLAVDSRENPRSLKVRLKTSKTDPFRRGVDVYVGRTGNKLPGGSNAGILGKQRQDRWAIVLPPGGEATHKATLRPGDPEGIEEQGHLSGRIHWA